MVLSLSLSLSLSLFLVVHFFIKQINSPFYLSKVKSLRGSSLHLGSAIWELPRLISYLLISVVYKKTAYATIVLWTPGRQVTTFLRIYIHTLMIVLYSFPKFWDHHVRDDVINSSEKQQALLSDEAHLSITNLKFFIALPLIKTPRFHPLYLER